MLPIRRAAFLVRPTAYYSWPVVLGGFVRRALRETVNLERVGSIGRVLKRKYSFSCCSVSQQVLEHFPHRDSCKVFPIPYVCHTLTSSIRSIYFESTEKNDRQRRDMSPNLIFEEYYVM